MLANHNSVAAETNNSVILTRNATKEPKSIQWILISIVLLFLSLFLVVPLIAIFVKAFEKGADAYFAAIAHPDSMSAIKLTLIVVLITLPLNAIFGVVAAWTITKYEFKGKNFLITLIDLPFSVSPVIAGLIFVLLFGLHGALGPLLQNYDIKVIFSIPGIVIASIFITFPFIARELIPLMQSQGTSEEEASLTLGAGGFKTFWYVTLPNIKWGLLYGVILCNARTIGEFGAVSVVSGHIRGMTNTMPLHIEILYNEYQFSAAFAVASLMSIFAIITLVIKSFIEWKTDFKSSKVS
ncbi:sulfate ABC transporter permease subunit CysW [Peribacillus butanolivorans]|uniref:sulfate ABC transporter permease subunit CysW n=1 Tax=Peribacillus butanolivorans TaxID=421767 RepID=UPI0037C62A02